MLYIYIGLYIQTQGSFCLKQQCSAFMFSMKTVASHGLEEMHFKVSHATLSGRPAALKCFYH